MKTEEREQARALRREHALSVKAIAQRLGVSSSSVSRWVRDVDLTPAQIDHLRIRAYEGAVKGRTMNSELHRAARVMAQQEGRELARRGEPLHLAGCMLYWAEGSKKRTQLDFSNSDPAMAQLFVAFLRTYFDLRDSDIRITCRLYSDHIGQQREIEQFWLDTLGLPASSLRKSMVNVYSKYSQKKRMNRLPYGTCRIVVSRVRVLQSILGAIQEYAGFERDAWLQ